ncbi:hypothetical protein [Clostridium sp.]|uniref:hypothetical protein n=1 Tax=Clostridium sp. TaxID=1506 RepID=UPI00321737F3
MGIHESNANSLPDSDFVNGDIKYIVKQNKCRLLDGRRTPGYIEEYFADTAMFRWRITDFEDKGNYWDVPAENIKSFQILKSSKELNNFELKELDTKIKEFDKELIIKIDELEQSKTEKEIMVTEEKIIEWLKENSLFLKSRETLNLDSTEGNIDLINDLKNYMKTIQIEFLEETTAKELVLNPNSEWIKGMNIVLAEMGVVSYKNKIPRGEQTFQGMGEKHIRRRYLIHRIAFVRAFFHLLNITEVLLYRGMCTEDQWDNFHEKSLTSWTFNLQVALSFCDLDKNNNYKNGYIFKRTIPIENIFMTYIETDEMNKQYRESEAILFFNKEKGIY